MASSKDDLLAGDWHELMRRYHATSCALDRELQSGHGLSVSEFEVLQQLATAPGRTMRLHDLGDRVHLTQSALSRLITRLCEDGLVDRTVCENDRRSAWTTLTTAGTDRYKTAKPTQRRVLRQLATA